MWYSSIQATRQHFFLFFFRVTKWWYQPNNQANEIKPEPKKGCLRSWKQCSSSPRVLNGHTEFYSREGRGLISELKVTYLCHRTWSYPPHKLLLKSFGKTDFSRLNRKFPDGILNLSMTTYGLCRLGQPCVYSSGHLLPLVQPCIFLRQFVMLRLYNWE